MTKFLLDTNILSDLIKRGRDSAVTKQIERVGYQRICTSVVVSAEIAYGVERKGSEALRLNAGRVLASLKIEPLAATVARVYGVIRADLERKGTPIGPNDLLIAAHARDLGYILVTDNVREFNRVEGLTVVNWLEQQVQSVG